MGNDIIPLLITQLKKAFNGLKIYDEPIQQNIETPAFIVGKKLLKRQRLANRNDSQLYFVHLQYVTEETDNICAELEAIENILLTEQFRYLGNKYHINDLEIEREQNTLIASFSIKILGRWNAEGIDMNSISGGVEVDEN